MDYEKLFESLPKKTKQWNVRDVETWLCIVGFENLYPRFKEASVDGSVLMYLDEADLREELKLKSSITVSKILTWIKTGLRQYDSFLESASQTKFSYHCSQKLLSYQKAKQQLQTAQKNCQEDQNQHQLVLLHCKMKNCYSVRAKQNIISSEEGCRPFDWRKNYEGDETQFALIDVYQKKYFLKSFGKYWEVYVKIDRPVKVLDGMQFWYEGQFFISEYCYGELQIINQNRKKKVLINQAPFSLVNQQIFQLHSMRVCPIAMITKKNGQFYIEQGNGEQLWIRIKDLSYELKDGTEFRIGEGKSGEFVCNFFRKREQQPEEKCAICYSKQKNCLLLKCRHNISCVSCGKTMMNCPVCRSEVEDIQTIYQK